MRHLICLALMLLPLVSFAAQEAEQLFKIRYQAFAISSELLLYYNPSQEGGDPRHAEGYRRGVAQLQRLVASGPQTLQEPASELQRSIERLEAQPDSADQVILRPTWINPILEAQASLDRQAERLYDELPDDPRRVQHALQLELARLLLLYQTRTFGSLGVYVIGISDDSFERFDQQIIAGFDNLRGSDGNQASELEALRRKYEFIRPRLLHHNQDWVPESAFYYLDAIARRLDEL